MILEVQKINDQYVIKNPPKTSDAHFYLKIEQKDILKSKPGKKKMLKTDVALEELKALAIKFPDDVFLQNKIKYYVPYTNPSGKSDDDYLNEALKEKYGL